MATDIPEVKDHHFYVVTGDTWVTDEDLFKALTKLKKATGIKKAYYMVVHVPLPEESSYEINMYVPDVEGAKVIADGHF